MNIGRKRFIKGQLQLNFSKLDPLFMRHSLDLRMDHQFQDKSSDLTNLEKNRKS